MSAQALAAFKSAGFSARAAYALAYSDLNLTPEQLRSLPWGNPRRSGSLAWRISLLPRLGPKGLAEIEAFRAGRDPASARPPGEFKAVVPLPSELLDRLDAWIAQQPDGPSRPEAIRRMIAAATRRDWPS
jgi:hypothetical protein